MQALSICRFASGNRPLSVVASPSRASTLRTLQEPTRSSGSLGSTRRCPSRNRPSSPPVRQRIRSCFVIHGRGRTPGSAKLPHWGGTHHWPCCLSVLVIGKDPVCRAFQCLFGVSRCSMELWRPFLTASFSRVRGDLSRERRTSATVHGVTVRMNPSTSVPTESGVSGQ